MVLNPLKRFSRLAEVPADLASVTDLGIEVPEGEARLRRGSVQALWSRLEALYRTGVQPGLQLCIRHRGKIVLNRALGHARGNEPGRRCHIPAPMRVATPINLFSAGKAVTAMLVHKLQELGHFNIDDRVAEYIPGFDRNGKQRITIRQLLTHRAGVPHLPKLATLGFDLDLLSSTARVQELILDLKPHAEIGGVPAYHALSGGFILAEVIRRATKQDPRELLKTLIKDPLGAEWLDFGVQPEDVDKVALNAETGVLPQPIAWQMSRILGAPYSKAIEMSNDPRFLAAVVPSGNVITTAQDIASFYQCLLDGGRFDGRQVFAADTVQRAITPDRRHASLDRTIGIPIRYSPGFMVGHRGLGLYGWNRRSTFGHLGLSSTLTWARPDTGTVVALVTNGKPVLGPHLKEMLLLFAGLNAFCENQIARVR